MISVSHLFNAIHITSGSTYQIVLIYIYIFIWVCQSISPWMCCLSLCVCVCVISNQSCKKHIICQHLCQTKLEVIQKTFLQELQKHRAYFINQPTVGRYFWNWQKPNSQKYVFTKQGKKSLKPLFYLLSVFFGSFLAFHCQDTNMPGSNYALIGCNLLRIHKLALFQFLN